MDRNPLEQHSRLSGCLTTVRLPEALGDALRIQEVFFYQLESGATFERKVMDSNASHYYGSQNSIFQNFEDEPILSQFPFSHPPYYPFDHHPPYPIPNGFTAMLNSPSVTSPFAWGPPNHNVSPYSLNYSPTLNTPNPTSFAIPQSSPMLPRPMPQTSLNKNPITSQAQAAKAKRKADKRKSHNIKEVVEDSQAQRKKPRASKKNVVVVDLGDEEDYGKEKGKWKDFWVDQLIHVRGGINEEFNKPVKQGVNLWANVTTQLAATYPDFDKYSEGCRKKFSIVLAQYRIDKTHNAISGNNKRHTFRWYDVINAYYHDRATSTPLSHGSSITQDGPMEHGKGESTKEGEKPPLFIASKKGITPRYEGVFF
ncbi:hypothetical protein L7F22_023892 [Adiantum nelumboides]|nr:hypothetical protein [Adiantum nelumboides]